MNIKEIIRLSELLGEMGQVKRATHLPNGDAESDSHHSFSLAMVAYHITKTYCPELDADMVMRLALAHDLLEIVTGDVDTLYFTAKQHAEKQEREQQALGEFDTIFDNYPDLKKAVYEYEKLDTQEAATVFVLDKACTTWTWLHHHDMKNHAINRRILSKADVEAWAERQRVKFRSRLKIMPPQKILEVYEDSFAALQNLYEE